MAQINLLPTELTPQTNVVKFSNTLKQLVTIGLVIVFTASMIVASLIVIYLFQINSLNKQNQDLKTKITSLENTETKFVLVKDRIQKANEVFGKDVNKTKLNSLTTIITNKPDDVSITSVDLGLDRFSMSFTTASSASLVNFMSGLVSGDFSKKIVLTNFAYTNTGYSVNLDLN